MTGYLIDQRGTAMALPWLLQWNFKYTDGDPCDGFSVRACLTVELARAVEAAVRFRAVEGGQTVFTGVVDDFELSVDRQGLLAEITGRGMAAVLLDNQVCAAEYQSAQLKDILDEYVRPLGITAIQAQSFSAVDQFVVETGYSCWQVLAGFCRHSENVFPRFLADGTLVLQKDPAAGTLTVRAAECTQLRVMKSWYGRISRQILINTRTGGRQFADDAEFTAAGGRCVKVRGMTGNKIRAIWRNAEQRVEDARRNRSLVEVTLPGQFLAWPLDRVRLTAEKLGILGTFTVQAAESMCDESGVRCTLLLRE